jgi:pyruvate/2-oxoacid:ferredoxin oxidoreductase beta subunit
VELKYPRREFMEPGHLACAGCGAALAMRLALKTMDEKTRVVIPASCWSIIAGRHPDATLKLPLIHTPFAVAPSVATGIKGALERLGHEEITVMVWAGDGSSYDIGFGSLSAAAERNEDIIYVCYDNEAYMNTGIQRSSATPPGAWTTTTPYPALKKERKKDILSALLAHGIPYAATASPSYPRDFLEKFQKARNIKGFRFILVLSPCPTGWRMEENRTIEIGRLAVESGVFPLVEVIDGRWHITHEPSWIPVEKYLEPQGRFRNMGEEQIKAFKEWIQWRWQGIRKMEGR